MSALGDLLAEHCALATVDVDHLHSLVGQWQWLADLSFADLLLLVPRPGGGFVCASQVRPATGATAHPDDEVGRLAAPGERHAVERALRDGRIVRDGEPEWRGAVPVREEIIPVRGPRGVIGAVVRDTNLAAARVPSQLELAYLETAGELDRMTAEGSFPFREGLPDADLDLANLAGLARVGDGMMRVAPSGAVDFASPNALSAYRRLGLRGNLVGESLHDVHAGLGLPGAPVALTLQLRQLTVADLVTDAAEVLLRAVPLFPGGAPTGALVLLHDVTELRRREQALMVKDATIREIHHRVKNNLQTVAALLRLQSRRTPGAEARAALEESVRRVTSIALVHETLSQTLDEAVAFDSIADQLAGAAAEVAATGGRAHVRRTGSFGVLSGAAATTLALILSELLQNAAEHAFGGDGGEVEIRVRRDARGLEVTVADNGTGLPPGFVLQDDQGLGLSIVRTLVVGELRGAITLRAGAAGGTDAVVTVPISAL